MEHLAIDLGGSQSQVCIRNHLGDVLLEQKVDTPRLGNFLKRRPHSRVILETCAEAFHTADAALEHGHEVRVVPATLVRQLGVGEHGVKTERRDAQKLSEVSCRIDLPSVHIRSEWARQTKAMLGARQGLVEARTQLINNVRGWLRTQVIGLRAGKTVSFPQRVRDKLLTRPDGMPAFIERQLRVIDELTTQIQEADAEVKDLAEGHDICCRLMTVPGVGPMTALTFVAVVDDVSRFSGANKLESYLGLTPGERSSSRKRCLTSITKAGPPLLRRILSQACWCVWRVRPGDPLVLWGKQVAARRGKQVANTAMCRKLAGILFAIWRDGTKYDPVKVSHLVSGDWAATI